MTKYECHSNGFELFVTKLVQDDVDFEKAEEHISVEVGKEALTSLTWGGHEHDHDLGNTIEDGTRYLRVIEDTVTRVECGVTRAYPRPRVTWSGDRDVTVIPVRSHVFGDSVTYDNVTHEYSLLSSVLYTARLNDTNSTLSCNVLQEDLYTTRVESVTIIVDPKPLPLIKVNNAVVWLVKDVVRSFTTHLQSILQCCNSTMNSFVGQDFGD